MEDRSKSTTCGTTSWRPIQLSTVLETRRAFFAAGLVAPPAKRLRAWCERIRAHTSTSGPESVHFLVRGYTALTVEGRSLPWLLESRECLGLRAAIYLVPWDGTAYPRPQMHLTSGLRGEGNWGRSDLPCRVERVTPEASNRRPGRSSRGRRTAPSDEGVCQTEDVFEVRFAVANSATAQ